MILTLAEIAAATGGTLHDTPDPQLRVTGTTSSDSRQIGPGGMFVALPGARVDGHDFVAQAVTAGAVCVLAERPVGVPAIVVDDVATALGRLAQHVLTRTEAQVIAVTGSAGKTSTKDLLAQVLAHHGVTVASPQSFNSKFGLPLTVLRAQENTRYLVLEMGARYQGDIAHLASLATPRIGLVLNVGDAHLAMFGGRDQIAAAKGELVEALPPAAEGGVAVLNADDPRVAAMETRTPARVVRFSAHPEREAEIRATSIELNAGRAAFTLHTPHGTAPVRLRGLGAHQVHNALAAAAGAHILGMATDQIAQALSEAEPKAQGRLEPLEQKRAGLTIINDAFNASPASMRAALHTLASIGTNRRTIAVLGEMRELGDQALSTHADIGRLLGELAIDILVTVGTTNEVTTLATHAVTAHPNLRTEATDTPDALLPLLKSLLQPGDVVLVKASRRVGLETFGQTLHSHLQDLEISAPDRRG
ncbi:UDP-N-acetylmuramoyl-tripeptide--D-alanyl-D-alanine ligase [Streptomyces profundus]|uniref:UDP-N-acetylmuramoyl-tripeptide--D-alanyl-D- alanine ligase n=1 Tax=Streptomyces profundus TaxID=2867410 RepID=UPI001D163DC7|nr:UDP-N-acetylmuramoyl-tripeptide--D-alanyl-D-alanine ligase [Streptomyces sp. MA3_2.13]UED86315.1 UDP-N-acetylmuramoyl-tripeptide--D-alanyl-D-alanine ligase [Streptomyces sp. MA3_2.13]